MSTKDFGRARLAMWADLKQAELRGLRERRSGRLSSKTVAKLRDLLEAVRGEPDADVVICFHGASALLREADGLLSDAVRHREIEIALILRLHELMRGEAASSVAFALQDYGADDLAIRRELLSFVRQAMIDSGG